MKKKNLILPGVAVLAVLILSAGVVSAYGGPGMGFKKDPVTTSQNWDEMMKQKAEVLGITLEEMKNYWSQGKNVAEIAKEKGISQETIHAKMQAARETEMKEWLQSLVSQGKITQAQADARLNYMKNNLGKGGKKGGMGHMKGQGMGMMKNVTNNNQ